MVLFCKTLVWSIEIAISYKVRLLLIVLNSKSGAPPVVLF